METLQKLSSFLLIVMQSQRTEGWGIGVFKGFFSPKSVSQRMSLKTAPAELSKHQTVSVTRASGYLNVLGLDTQSMRNTHCSRQILVPEDSHCICYRA